MALPVDDAGVLELALEDLGAWTTTTGSAVRDRWRRRHGGRRYRLSEIPVASWTAALNRLADAGELERTRQRSRTGRDQGPAFRRRRG